MIRSGTRLVAVAVALSGTGAARADGWNGYASLGAGVALNSTGSLSMTGGSLQLFLGVETPVGLTFGATVEGLNAWGPKEPTVNGGLGRRMELSSRLVGFEARLRLLRDARISPWRGGQVGYSFDNTLFPRFGSSFWDSYSSEGPTFAARLGLDVRVSDHWGLSLSGSAQACAARYFGDYTEECMDPVYGFHLGPTFRF